jgi:hypothetical protein
MLETSFRLHLKVHLQWAGLEDKRLAATVSDSALLKAALNWDPWPG